MIRIESPSIIYFGFYLLLVGCGSTPDPGISREKAESILRDFNLTDNINISPSPEGWWGTARFADGGYSMQIKITKDGFLELTPDECRC